MTNLHRTTIRVIYGDTDTMGYAYHANYLRWFEIGRTEMFRDLGLPYKEIENRGIFLPVAEVNCRFLAPVHYDDLLVVETRLDTTVRAGMKFEYVLKADGVDEIKATGFTLHPFVNGAGKVVRPPKFILDVLAQDQP